MRAELRIRDNYYPLTTELPVSMNLVLADIREPDKRNASYTKSIALNATNEINKLFENIFESNIATQTFNPNKKEEAVYYIDGLPVFSGKLQLLKITIANDGNIQYSCNIFGEGGSLFLDIGDKELSALDFSAYNHTYNRDNQRASWLTPDAGTGYYYPFINYGSNGGSSTSFGVKDFKPCFYLFEYLDKIITDAGYTWESTYLESSEGKSLIVVDNNKGIPLSQSQLEDRQFYVGLGTDEDITSPPTLRTIEFDTETAPFFDPNGIYNTGTFMAEVPENGNYNTVVTQNARMWWTHSDGSVVRFQGNVQFNLETHVQTSSDGGATFTSLAVDVGAELVYTTVGLEFPSTDHFVNHAAASGDAYLSQGTKIRGRHRFTPLAFVGTFYDAFNVAVLTGTATLHCEVQGVTGTSMYCLATGKTASEGNPILGNNFIPQKIKQRDLLKSVMQLLNLNIDVDKQNSKHLIIETWPDFYNQGVVNWENRTDLNRERIINPLAFIEGKKYIFKYKQDKDFYNNKYQDTYAESFGTHTKEIDNDFLKQDKTNEIIFSPTPNVANYPLGIAVPAIYKSDGVSISPETPNIRLLFAGGVKSTFNQWNHTYLGTDLFSSDYGYAGHTDDPFNPTLDLNFGIPKEVYYSYINAYFTNNNCYNRFHRPLIDNTTSRDSKIVTKYLWLTPKDINEFTFRKLYFIDDAYYIVNKIIDYNPLDYNSTKCELIKLIEAEVFVPESTPIFGDPMFSGDAVETPNSNRSFGVGTNVRVYGNNCIGVGENIIIPATCNNITAIGNNLSFAENLSNVSVINTNDLNVTQSNYSVTNGATVGMSNEGTVTTTNATPDSIVFDTPTGEFTTDEDSVYRMESRILATDLLTGDSKEWEASGVARDLAATVSYNDVIAPTSVFSDPSMTTASIVISGMPTEQVNFQVTGIAATTIQWKVTVSYIKINL